MKLTTKDVKEFEIDLTGTCNLNCPLCTRNYKHAQHLLNKNIRPLKDIIKQLDYFPNLNRIMVAGAISEPTLYPELFGFIEYLNTRNIRVDLFSNGSTKDVEYWKQLGIILHKGNPLSSCTFTICGSNNEIHSKYRVGSDLNKILENAKAFRNSVQKDARDILQLIEFKYNTDDLKSDNMKKIVDEFTHSYIVGTEGRRRLTEFVVQPEKDISPLIRRENAINSIFKNRRLPGSTKIDCKTFHQGKMHINQFGQMHYCYMSMEFPESKDDFVLKDPNDLHDDYIFDFTKVHNFEYPDCFLCEKNTRRLIEVSGLDFVC